MCTLTGLAASEKIHLEVADMNNDYIYGDLDVPIIMKQPTDSSQELDMPEYKCEVIHSVCCISIA